MNGNAEIKNIIAEGSESCDNTEIRNGKTENKTQIVHGNQKWSERDQKL